MNDLVNIFNYHVICLLKALFSKYSKFIFQKVRTPAYGSGLRNDWRKNGHLAKFPSRIVMPAFAAEIQMLNRWQAE